MTTPGNGLRRALAFAAIALGSFVVGLATCTAVGGLFAMFGNRLADLLNGRVASPPMPFFGWAEVPELLRAWCSAMAEVVGELVPDGPTGIAVLAIAVLATAAPALLSAPALGRWDGEPNRRSLRASVAGASILGGACALGILMTLWDALALALWAVGAIDSDSIGRGSTLLAWNGLPLFAAWLAAGLAWAWLLARAGAARRPDRIDRTVRWIFRGTCLELAIAAPTYVFAMRRDSCWCSWGSWLAITAGTTALVLLCGPALLLMATREARLRWVRTVCADCGYPRRGGEARCPECGTVHRAPGGATATGG
ncbi:MAG: hypothetical protein FGM39_03980 [Phycisphaerales bacterium]|nr:hypothetical protein [Phycisphaerales bacterium]